jgi:hypothetical protein
MTETRAWLTQAESDYDCIGRILDVGDRSTYCHAIAKCQQAVEKSVKALVAAARDHRGARFTIGWRHEVEQFITGLIRLSRSANSQDIQFVIRSLFDEPTRDGIRRVHELAPRRPPPGGEPALNTEYPYRKGRKWRAPSEVDAFSRSQVDDFRRLAHRVTYGCGRVISAVERSV